MDIPTALGFAGIMAKEAHVCHFSQSTYDLVAYRQSSINLDSNTKSHVWKGDLAPAAAGTVNRQWGDGWDSSQLQGPPALPSGSWELQKTTAPQTWGDAGHI